MTIKTKYNIGDEAGLKLPFFYRKNSLEDFANDDSFLKPIYEQQEKVNEWIKMVLYTYAKPQIKGEITIGKLKWRGIKMRQIHNGKYETLYEVVQRGEVLGRYTVKIIKPTIIPRQV